MPGTGHCFYGEEEDYTKTPDSADDDRPPPYSETDPNLEGESLK